MGSEVIVGIDVALDLLFDPLAVLILKLLTELLCQHNLQLVPLVLIKHLLGAGAITASASVAFPGVTAFAALTTSD